MKKFLFSHKQITTYFLESERINTLQTFPEGVNSHCFLQGSFQLLSWAMESKGKPLKDSIIDYFKKL